MFSPLTIRKNRIDEINRLDNSQAPANTSGKKNGYFSTNSSYWGFTSGTVVCRTYPNSVDLRYTGPSGNRFKWMMFNIENNSQAAWWSLVIAADDNIQVGGGSGYSLLDNTLGWKKGQIGIQTRFRPGGVVADGLILIDSGSFYDWNDPQPIHIAYVNDQVNSQFRASINGETKPVVGQARANDPDWSNWLFWGDLGTTDNNDLTLGYSPGDFNEILMSGSYNEFQFYTASLTQDEINVITAQPFGCPGNVLDKQPQVHYIFTEDHKVPVSVSQTSNETGVAYNNIGTDTSYTTQFVETTLYTNAITSGSVLDGGIKDYRGRL